MAGMSVIAGLQLDERLRVGRFPVVGRLSEDGLGLVYLAKSLSGLHLTVRVISPAVAGSPRIRGRLAREIHAAAAVASPFTVRIVDADMAGPEPWVAAEYVPGPTMELAVTEQGPLEPGRLLVAAAALASGLRDIHRAGLVHRDLQPSRVILGTDHARISDLGAAVSGLEALAATGGLISSPDYLSPEQADLEEVSAATDIFGLGAVLTFAATGRGPFGSGPPPEVLSRIVNDAPNLTGVAERIRPLLTRCLAKRPAERPSGAELLEQVYALANREAAPDIAVLIRQMATTATASRVAPLSAPSASPASGADSGKAANLSQAGTQPGLDLEIHESIVGLYGAAQSSYGAAESNGRRAPQIPPSPSGNGAAAWLPPGSLGGEFLSPGVGMPGGMPGVGYSSSAADHADYSVLPASQQFGALASDADTRSSGQEARLSSAYPAPAAPNAPALASLPVLAAPQSAPTSSEYRPAITAYTPSAAASLGRGTAVSERGQGKEAADFRFLMGDLPERAPVGARISLLVRITQIGVPGSALLKKFHVPPGGTTVTITVSAPGLIPLGDLEQDLDVPSADDSEPVRFGFKAGQTGLHSVDVRAFAAGTCLGELALQISVESGAPLKEGRLRTAVMTGLAAEPGEVTLQVSRTAGGYSFQLLSEELHRAEPVDLLAGDPAHLVAKIAAELKMMARGKTPYSSPVHARNRLRALGAELWADVVPEAIRRQFWAQRNRIELFSIASDINTMPWELIYPVDLDNEDGFLVEQFPVVRRVYGQSRARSLRLDSGAAYVVPPRSPTFALDEVAALRGILPAEVTDRGIQGDLAEVFGLLDAMPSVLHFAGHSAFTDEAGSVISLEGGPLRPDDLAYARQKRAFAAVSPLIFLNGCRTASEIAGFTQMNGWAEKFMGAGAGAFIGSLWAVRSSSAKLFAEEFYRSLVHRRQSLGMASLQARRAIAADDGDPTWLAYTVYGNPSASIERLQTDWNGE